MKWLRTIIISKQEFKKKNMRYEITWNAVIKAFMNAYNEICEQMNTVDETA